LLIEGMLLVILGLASDRHPLSRKPCRYDLPWWMFLITLGLARCVRNPRSCRRRSDHCGASGIAHRAIWLLVGIDLVFGGFALIGMALAGRRIDGIPTNCGYGRVPPIN
jgi:hypothetical protein